MNHEAFVDELLAFDAFASLLSSGATDDSLLSRSAATEALSICACCNRWNVV